MTKGYIFEMHIVKGSDAVFTYKYNNGEKRLKGTSMTDIQTGLTNFSAIIAPGPLRRAESPTGRARLRASQVLCCTLAGTVGNKPLLTAIKNDPAKAESIMPPCTNRSRAFAHGFIVPTGHRHGLT